MCVKIIEMDAKEGANLIKDMVVKEENMKCYKCQKEIEGYPYRIRINGCNIGTCYDCGVEVWAFIQPEERKPMKEERIPMSLNVHEWNELNGYIDGLGERTEKFVYGCTCDDCAEYQVWLTEEEMKLAQFKGTRHSPLWKIIQQAGINRLGWNKDGY